MIITIIGARPQFVKAAVLSAQLKKMGIEELIIHTGQHYDYKMSEVFFEELGIHGAKINLNIGSGSHGQQTAEMLIAIEKILIENIKKVQYVLLYGDTNSTLAGALAASKLNIPIIHVEAGLRSFNKTMPEEINRITTDHLSSILFCSSNIGMQQLAKENIVNNVYMVGDIMLDAYNTYSAIAPKKVDINSILSDKYNSEYLLLTIHRPANTDNIENLKSILTALSTSNKPIIWPLHPRLKSMVETLDIPENVHLFQPFSYFEMLQVLNSSFKVITDSGGLQKEAYWAKKPCITIRPETEWVETLHNNWNVLVDADIASIQNALNIQPTINSWTPLYGNCNTAEKICDILKNNLNTHNAIN